MMDLLVRLRFRPGFRLAAGLAVILTFLLGPLQAADGAESLDGRAIMDRNDEQQTARDEQVAIAMKLIRRKGRERRREVFQVIKTDPDGTRKALVRFTAPADVEGTGLLTLEHKDRDDDQWFYLPALHRTRRITPADQTDSFMGTEFTFEDFKREALDDFHYTLKGSDEVDGVDSFRVEAVPANEKKQRESGYSRREIWVRKSDFVISQVKYYDQDDQLMKVFTAHDIQPIGDSGKSRAHLLSMENVKDGNRTELVLSDFVLDQQLGDDQFSLRYLENPS